MAGKYVEDFAMQDGCCAACRDATSESGEEHAAAKDADGMWCLDMLFCKAFGSSYAAGPEYGYWSGWEYCDTVYGSYGL
jgi:hypothetical protein